MTFSTAQFKSKVARLGLLQAEMAPAHAPASDPAAVLTSDWLKSILLLMSAEVSKPGPAHCALCAEALTTVGFWPGAKGREPLVWMNLKGFFSDLVAGAHGRPLIVGDGHFGM